MFLRLFIGAVLLCVITAQYVQAKVTVIPEVIVEAEAITEEKGNISIKSETLPSSVHVITKEEIEKMPIFHYLDIFRKLPGMYLRNYGEGDIADGIGMRGYPSGHVKDIGVFIDGVPVNVPHHSHTHGWADIGWLTPEMIERVEVIKGPFSALYGNFALAGVINIITKKSDISPAIGAEAGSYGSYRGTATISKSDWKPTPFLFYEAYTKDGYRDNSDYTRYNFFNKLTVPLWDGKLSIRAHYVKREWNFAGYLYLDEVKSGIRKRTDATSKNDGGDSENINLVLNYSPKKGEEGLHATIYLSNEKYQHYATYSPDPQGWEPNERKYYGWNILYNFVPMKNLSLIIGTDGRYDDGSMKQYETIDRVVVVKNDHWDIKELSIGIFAQTQYKPFDFLKLVGGIRYDKFDYDIENIVTPKNSGKGDTDIISPKIGLVITPVKNLDIFANKGRGFRSPAAREMSPSSPNREKNFDLKPAKVDSWDIGLNTFLFERLYTSFNYYYTEMEREVRRVGPEFINIGLSERKGFEFETRFYIANNFALYGNYAYVKGRIKNPAVSGQDKISGLSKDTLTIGAEYQKSLNEGRQLTLDFLYTWLGESPLNATGTVMRPDIDRYMLKAAYKIRNVNFFIATTYHPKKYASESFFYWDPPRFLYDPKPQWDVNAGIKYQF